MAFKRTLTILASLAVAAIVQHPTGPASAQGRISCNHDPVCQAKRDGTSVAEARRRDRAVTACIKAAGYTEEAWRAYSVPAGPADQIRACFRKNNLPL